MKLVISDIGKDQLNVSDDIELIENNGKIHHCVGCFKCWIKTPGKCVILDGFEETGKKLSRCTELIIVSQCVYGSTSPFVKNVVDRALSYIHPNFCNREGAMHHKRRYTNKLKISAYFYGDTITEKEKETARKLIKANAVNYDGEVGQIAFFNNADELRGVQL